MSTLNVNRIVDASGGVMAPISSVFKNRIINGAMVIDQRNAGASVTPTNGQYTLDRWTCNLNQASKFSVQQNAGSVTPPAGFSRYLGVTSLSAYSVTGSDYFGILQSIEGFNMQDLAWGTANAKTITLSFWVRSSLTGTFGGALRSDTTTSPAILSYPFSYTISAANTWEQKSITIAGPTNGTWVTGNTTFVQVWLGLGAAGFAGTAGAWASSDFRTSTGATSVVGTNGATFYITGVQLEVGTQATSFEYRQFGTELNLCQRYFEKSYPIETAPAENTATGESFKNGIWTASEIYVTKINFVCTKRATPTITYYRPTQSSTDGRWAFFTSGWNTSTNTTTDFAGVNGFNPTVSTSPALTNNNAYLVQGGWVASAEL